MSALVLDSSVTMSWFLPRETTARTKKVLEDVTDNGAVVPSLWRLEVGNTLLLATRRNQISLENCASAITALENLPIEFDSETDSHAWNATFHFASRHRLTLYDASYLELAHRLRLPLATLDKELRTAGKELGLLLLGV